MATLPDVMLALVQKVVAATTGLTVNSQSIEVEVGEGWPNLDQRQDVARGQLAVVGVYHKLTTYSKPYFPYTRTYTDNPIGIKSVLNTNVIDATQTATITISYAPSSTQVNQDDAISLVVQNGNSRDAGVAVAASGETLTSLATKLAAAINGRSTLSSWISASSSGPVVTLTNNGSTDLILTSYAGNTRNLNRSVQKAHRNIRIVVWSGDKDIRDTVGVAIGICVTGLEDNYGYTTSSGELIRVVNQGERPDDQNMQGDIYRVDYQLLIEHSVDVPDEAWSVLAPIQNLHEI